MKHASKPRMSNLALRLLTESGSVVVAASRASLQLFHGQRILGVLVLQQKIVTGSAAVPGEHEQCRISPVLSWLECPVDELGECFMTSGVDLAPIEIDTDVVERFRRLVAPITAGATALATSGGNAL